MRMAGLKHRRRWALLATLTTLAGLVLGVASNPVGATGQLGSSTFESGDGNLAASSSSVVDWVNSTGGASSPAPHFAPSQDAASGSADNAYGQGAKEDIDCPTVVNGSIPPNKSDLKRFYVSYELVGTKYFMYVSWERSNVLGNANMDFEFQQGGSACPSTSPHETHRTAKDRLITFDFGGSGTPTLALLTWVTGATTPDMSATADGSFNTNVCYSSNSFPCWGDRRNLSDGGQANGAVNTATVTDPLGFTGSTPRDGNGDPVTVSLPAGTFGEAGINLTDTGVLVPATSTSSCTLLSTASLNSRSSSSFTSEIKDFIQPYPVNITNCEPVSLKKVDGAGAGLAGATLELWKETSGDTSLETTGGTTDTLVETCVTAANDNGTSSDTSDDFYGCKYLLPEGRYYAIETAAPSSAYTLDTTVNVITVSFSDTATSYSVTFTDNAAPGDLTINKTDDTGAAMSGVVFTLYNDDSNEPPQKGSATSYTCTTGDGSVTQGGKTVDSACKISGIDAGFYWIDEAVPTGYSPDSDLPERVEVTAGGSLSKSYTNDRLFKVITVVCQKFGDGGLYAASVGYDSTAAPATANTPTSISGVDAASLCAASGDYVHDDVKATTHTGNVSIS